MTNKEIKQAMNEGNQVILARDCTAPAYQGQRTTAKIVSGCSPEYKRNQEAGYSVYRVKDFCLVGEVRGWALMTREYTTLAGLLNAATKVGCTVEIV